jgi:hypothetical protein
VEEDGDLDELDERGNQFAHPVGGKAKQQAAFCVAIDGTAPLWLPNPF